MSAFVPEQFAEPVISPSTATLFRRTPYISPSDYNQTPTAVATNNLVPGGSSSEQVAELASVISRASDWVDTICFHKGDGTLAAAPTTDAAWIKPRENGALGLICNFKPILEVDGLAVGYNAQNMQNIGSGAARSITIEEPIIWVQNCNLPTRGASLNGKVYVMWIYVNGYPHTSLAENVGEGEEEIKVKPSQPGGVKVYGVYPGTQLTIHDEANTEVILVKEINGLDLVLSGPLQYAHSVPKEPDTVRVSAIPWTIEQACVSLTSALIKMRGSRAMIMPGVGGGAATKQSSSQAGGVEDFETACELLMPFIVPYIRST